MSATFHIDLPEIFDFDLILKYLDRSPLEILHQVVDRQIFKLISAEGKNYLCRLAYLFSGHLQVELLNQQITETNQAIVKKYIIQWFDLDRDIVPFYEMSLQDPLLSKVVPEFKGLRLIGVNDIFEALSWAIIGQQINLPFAYTLKKRLIETFGTKVKWNGKNFLEIS